MSDEQKNDKSLEPTSELSFSIDMPDPTVSKPSEPELSSPLDEPIKSTPTVPSSNLPPPPVLPDLPPPPPISGQASSSSIPPPPPPPPVSMQSPYSPTPYTGTTPSGSYTTPSQYSQYHQPPTPGATTGNNFFKCCCVGCLILIVLFIIFMIISLNTCKDIFGGMGSLIGEAIELKTKSKSEIESLADTSFTLEQLAANPDVWLGKYVVFETTADVIDSNDPDSQVITVNNPLTIIVNLNPNLNVQPGMPIRVWGKVSKFNFAALTKFVPELPKDAKIAGFIVAATIEPRDGSGSRNQDDSFNPGKYNGKPPANDTDTQDRITK